jgi:hypothetical protein
MRSATGSGSFFHIERYMDPRFRPQEWIQVRSLWRARARGLLVRKTPRSLLRWSSRAAWGCRVDRSVEKLGRDSLQIAMQ